MIPSTLRVTLIAAVICYFIIILYFLKNRALNLKYTLLWLLAGVVMGILVIFPDDINNCASICLNVVPACASVWLVADLVKDIIVAGICT